MALTRRLARDWLNLPSMPDTAEADDSTDGGKGGTKSFRGAVDIDIDTIDTRKPALLTSTTQTSIILAAGNER